MDSQERSHCGPRRAILPSSISKPNKVQKRQFQTSGILFFTDVQKLYRPEISQFLTCMLQLWKIHGGIFSNYIG